MRRRQRPEEIRSHLIPDDFLDDDAHFFWKIEEVSLGAVLYRIGAEGGGVHLGDGVEEGQQTLSLRALVGDEKAFIFAREGCALAIFE